MMIKFGRKINVVPLLISLVIGVAIGYFLDVVFDQTIAGILFGVLGFMAAIVVYSINLSRSYGYWEITDRGINCYDYSTNGKRFKAIMFPFGQTQSQIDFQQIESISLIAVSGFQVPEITKAAPASAYIVQTFVEDYASPYYLRLELNDDSEVDLDLSFDANAKAKIQKTLNFLVENTNKKIDLIEQ